MKKKLLILIITIFICTAASAKEEMFSISAGLSSGVPIYGNGSATTCNKDLSGKNQAIIGSVISLNLNLTDQFTLFLGNDILFDLNWTPSEYVHKIHISIPLGIKIYPGLGGFNVGLAYTIGFRQDLSSTKEFSERKEASAWGNGIKVLAEYNFAHEGKSRYYPTIGGYWTFMPRGNNSFDNLLAIYIAANF